ncbi:MAG: cytochrome [Gemmatimonadaceae bacterium]
MAVTSASRARRPVIGVMGAAEASLERAHAAEALGELLAAAGWVVLTGGRACGVMDAACRGAKRVAGSLTIGVLPGADDVPSDHVDVVIRSDLGYARNNVNVLSSDVVVACGVEGPGTASEVALALKNRRPVVLMAPGPAARAFFLELGDSGTRVRVVQSPEDAVEAVRHFLANTLG